jgi:hypothetical protein
MARAAEELLRQMQAMHKEMLNAQTIVHTWL